MKKALILAIFSILWCLPAQASVAGVYPGDLIKLKDDHDPRTVTDKVVYYFDKDWFRHPFPNQRVFETWFKDFTGVKEITPAEMASIRLAAPITYRPGTRLVKIPSIPKVYAVEPGGILRWIESEKVAKALYGDAWSKRVDDVDESYFAGYKEGAPITVAAWPTGTFVRRDSDTALFVIDGLRKRHVPPFALASLRLNEAQVVRTSSDLADYADAADMVEGDWKYLDASQDSRIDTTARPQFDFPVGSQPLDAGGDRALATFRITSGMPVIVRRLTVTIAGPLWDGGTPRLSDLRFVDVNGHDLFGVQQLASPGADRETLTFAGAYTMPADAISVVEFKAKISSSLGAGATFTVALDRDGVSLADGGNGDPLADFWPRGAFPSFTMTSK